MASQETVRNGKNTTKMYRLCCVLPVANGLLRAVDRNCAVQRRGLGTQRIGGAVRLVCNNVVERVAAGWRVGVGERGK